MAAFNMIWLLVSFVVVGAAADKGYFWHVTDFHYDHTFWDRRLSCNEDVPKPGPFGDYWCDSPWRLVKDSITNMARINPNVDFILWTGDNVAHIKDEHLSLAVNMEILQNITTALNTSFSSPVYASLGNHDFFPSDQANNTQSEIYVRVAEMWKSWAPSDEAQKTLKKGGYYMVQANKATNLIVLVLNTNLYYTANNITKNDRDPAEQFKWMREQLDKARQSRHKVIVTAHIPPGLNTPGLDDWMYPQHKAEMIDILTMYSDIIVGSHFGHEHADGFKILRAKDDATKALTQFGAPSVTPWRYKNPTSSGAAHNPAIRLVEYDRETGKHLNYEQYYIDLTDSNAKGEAKWTKLYSFTDAYNVPDMTVESLRKIFAEMEASDDRSYLVKYCNYNVVGTGMTDCSSKKQAHIYCGGMHSFVEQAQDCTTKYLEDLRNSAVLHTGRFYGMVVAAVLVCVIFMM